MEGYGSQELGGGGQRDSRRLYDVRAGWGESGFSLSFPEASELVILSAAGAKDLLSHGCEGRFSGAAGAKDLVHRCEGRFRAPQMRRTYFGRRRRGRPTLRRRRTAGPSLARVPRARSG